MAKIDVIKETLESRVASGELDYEDAEQVYEAALVKYGYVDPEEVTYENTMRDIRSYLESEGLCRRAKRLDEVPERHSSENYPRDLDNNDAYARRMLGRYTDEIDDDYDMDDGIEDANESAVDEIMDELDDLRLAAYESAECGIIDEDERDLMLDYLDIDNYDI